MPSLKIGQECRVKATSVRVRAGEHVTIATCPDKNGRYVVKRANEMWAIVLGPDLVPIPPTADQALADLKVAVGIADHHGLRTAVDQYLEALQREARYVPVVMLCENSHHYAVFGYVDDGGFTEKPGAKRLCPECGESYVGMA